MLEVLHGRCGAYLQKEFRLHVMEETLLRYVNFIKLSCG